MIKHEEVRKIILFVPKDEILLQTYIDEQQKKDELLELYREKDNHIENWENYDRSLDMGYIAKLEYLQEKIKALEEELK